PAEPAARGLGRRRRWVGAAAGGALALLLGGVVWLQFFRPVPGALPQPAADSSPRPAPPPLRPVPLNALPGRQYQPAFSPDGKWVAFAWDGEGHDNFDIYIQRLGPQPPQRLTDPPADEFGPAWRPPDGRQIAFARFDPATGR